MNQENTELNPYDSADARGYFVGHYRLLREIFSGFRAGKSFAILGGPRCGKSAVLYQICKTLGKEDVTPLTPIPCYISLKELEQLSSETIFKSLYTSLTNDLSVPQWSLPKKSVNSYKKFLALMAIAEPLVAKKYGKQWLSILLLDDCEAELPRLQRTHFFQSLDKLLSSSKFHQHFRAVLTGASGLNTLLQVQSSPLSSLEIKHLSILNMRQALEFIKLGFPEGFSDEAEHFIVQMTGRHPYLLEGVLEHLWQNNTQKVTKATIKRAVQKFIQEVNPFPSWVKSFGDAENMVYHALADADSGALSLPELIKAVPTNILPTLHITLKVLQFHGVIDDSDPDEPKVAGSMFRTWYRYNNLLRMTKNVKPSAAKRQAVAAKQ